MKGKKGLVAGLAIIVAGLALGGRALSAQGDDDNLAVSTLVDPGGRSWLGVELKDLSADQAREMKLGDSYGALVDQVEKDGPAAKAGLQAGDVIVEFGGEKVHSVAEMRRLVSETPPGRTVQIQVRRNGPTQTLTATVEGRTDALHVLSRLHDQVWPQVNVPLYDFSFSFGGPRLGVTVDALTPQLAEYFGVKGGKGVLVREVRAGSAADKAGIKAGDCIVKLDSTAIDSASELHRVLLRKQDESPDKGVDVAVTIVRNHQEQTLPAHLEPAPHPAPRAMTEPSSLNLPAADELEAQARSLLDAEGLAASAEALGRQFESQRGEIEQQAEAAQGQARQAADQARQLQKELLDKKGQWQQELQQLGPEMKKFQDEMKRLEVEFGPDTV